MRWFRFTLYSSPLTTSRSSSSSSSFSVSSSWQISILTTGLLASSSDRNFNPLFSAQSSSILSTRGIRDYASQRFAREGIGNHIPPRVYIVIYLYRIMHIGIHRSICVRHIIIYVKTFPHTHPSRYLRNLCYNNLIAVCKLHYVYTHKVGMHFQPTVS